MQTRQKTSTHDQGYSLLTVIAITGVSITMFAGLASLSSSSTLINDRNNVYNNTLAAAEAASETVVSYLQRDFNNQSFNPNNLTGYRALIPTNAWASAYRFADHAGNLNRSGVESSSANIESLHSQFEGLYGLVYNCTVRSQATPLGTPYQMAATVQQDIQLASIPVFQFAIFYAMDLEINPGAPMKVTGKVHSNGELYSAPPSTLEFCDDVTTVGRFHNERKPGDPTPPPKTTPAFDKELLELASSLTLPIATNNSPDAVRGILQVPPFGEDAMSQMGRSRYYNTVDLLVTVTASNVMVHSGYWNSFAAVLPDLPATTNLPARFSFITTNSSFYDGRESKYTLETDLDVARLNQWMTNAGSALNDLAFYRMGHRLNSVYINDLRGVANRLTAVRVSNGRYLPPSGLTVATPLPLYVLGHFNAPDTTPGLTNTAATKPASLVGDSITVLSGSWADTNSAKALSYRTPSDTTVNAAFLAGIVETTTAGGGHYSGGVENFPRFLENWSGRTFTYNGSMVVMFPSQYATSYWVQTGTYYNAPNRKWAFDINFLNFYKLPPATPQVRKLVRGQWTVLAAN